MFQIRRWLAPLAITLAACAPEPPADQPPTFEAFRASLLTSARGHFVVEGDLLIKSEAELHEFYVRNINPTSGLEDGEAVAQAPLTVDRKGFWWWAEDNKWTGGDEHALTYCVSTGFGGDYPKIVEAMRTAARDWERAANVRFAHLDAEDDNCDADNDAVLFPVQNQGNGCGRDSCLNASAFFPDEDDEDDRVIDVYSQTFAWTPADLTSLLTHELGHVLGFRHEHVRAGCNNESSNWRTLTSYDARSIMHYNWCTNGISGESGEVITPRDQQGAQKIYGAANIRRVALRTTQGKYVRAFNGGGGIVDGKGSKIGPWETFELIGLGGDSYALRSINRAFVTVEGGGPGVVNANRAFVNAWETFTAVKVGPRDIALRTSTGRYLTVGSSGTINTWSTWITDAAKLTVVELDTEPVALRVDGGQYARVSGDKLEAISGSLFRDEFLYLVNLGDSVASVSQVAFRTKDGRYLRAVSGGGGDLRLDRTIIGAHETFQIVPKTKNGVAILSHDGHYLAAEGGGGQALVADRTAFGAWEHFTVIWMRGLPVSIETTSGHYWRAIEGGGYGVDAKASAVNAWERFRYIDLGGDRFAMRAPNGQYVSAQNGGGSALTADRDWIGEWEQFELVNAGTNIFAFRTVDKGKYIAAEGAGGGALDANRDQVGAWERFDLHY